MRPARPDARMESRFQPVLLGTGAAAPDRTVPSSELDRTLDLPEGEVARRSGVVSRRWCDRLDQMDLAAMASHAALADAGIEADRLDAILHAAAVPYQAIPATAPLVQRVLGVPDGALAAFDINASCLGFLAALQLTAAMIEAGRWTRVLIVSAERASRGLDWSDPATAGLFGDGAGAAVIGRGQGPRWHIAQESHPSGYDASRLVAGGTRLDHDADPAAFEAHRRFAMDGPALFGLTRRRFGAFVDGVLAAAGWRMADVDAVVPHQASPRAMAHLSRALAIPQGRLVDIAADHGNQIAASLPVALDRARRDGRAGPGARVLLLGTAAGVSFGAAALQL